MFTIQNNNSDHNEDVSSQVESREVFSSIELKESLSLTNLVNRQFKKVTPLFFSNYLGKTIDQINRKESKRYAEIDTQNASQNALKNYIYTNRDSSTLLDFDESSS